MTKHNDYSKFNSYCTLINRIDELIKTILVKTYVEGFITIDIIIS